MKYATFRYDTAEVENGLKLKMDRNSLLLFHFIHQRLRGAKRRRALHRKRRRMYLLQVQQMNQNLRVLQMILTRTTLLEIGTTVF